MSAAYEAYLKWKQSKQGGQFDSAIKQAQRDQQLKKYSVQFKEFQQIKPQATERKDDAIQRELAGVDQWGQALGEFNQFTTQLPMRERFKGKSQGDNKNVQFDLAGTQAKTQNHKREKFAGMVDDTTWKYNPKSYYNQQNDGGKPREAYLADQRAFFQHRKQLADAIEKARNADPETESLKQEQKLRQDEAAEQRKDNRKAYLNKKARRHEKQKLREQGQSVQDSESSEIDELAEIRDGRSRAVNFEMTGKQCFSVSTNFSCPNVIVDILKQYQSMWNQKRREWTAHILKYKQALYEISSFCKPQGIYVDQIPRQMFEMIEFPVPFSDESKQKLIDFDYELDIKPQMCQLPRPLFNSLYDFQKQGVQFGIERYGRCLIGDEMGVGKTIQAICIAYLYRRDWPLIVICPSSLRFNWRDEFLNWLSFLRDHDIQLFQSAQDEFNPKCCIYIISYNIATRLAGIIQRKSVDFIIVDEAHYLKSRESLRAKNLVPVLMRSKRLLMLTGTPIMSRPAEIYNLLRCLRPDIFYSFKEFGMRYCNPKEEHYGIDWSGTKNQRELHMMIEGSLMIRRMKADVLTELPAKRRQKIAISTDSGKVKQIHWMLKKIKTWSDKIGRHGENVFGGINTDFDTFIKEKGMEDPNIARLDDKAGYLINAYGLTGKAKIKGILEFTETLIESRIKFIIFAHHFEVLDAIEEQVVKKKVSHVRIDGKIEVQKRYEAVRKFQMESECLIAILSLTACSTGITLTAASTVVFAEMCWTPGVMVQAEDRAHRIGQINSVNIYYLIGENTLDAMIYPRLKLKSEVFSNIVDGTSTDFQLQNEYEYNSSKHFEQQESKKESENKTLKKYLGINQQAMLGREGPKQGNITDHFFVNKQLKSTIKPQSSRNSIMSKVTEHNEYESQLASVISHSSVVIEQQECDDGYLPLPMELQNHPRTTIQIDQENWEEGTDTKSKAYRWLREQKDLMFDQNREWVKFRQVFRGLKRGNKRAKKPNQMTEYDIPIDTRVRGLQGLKTAECEFDPDEILQREFSKDETKEQWQGSTQVVTQSRFSEIVTNEQKGILGVQQVVDVAMVCSNKEKERERQFQQRIDEMFSRMGDEYSAVQDPWEGTGDTGFRPFIKIGGLPVSCEETAAQSQREESNTFVEA